MAEVVCNRTFESYLESGTFSDMIIRCADREFRAHKVIMCAQSLFFANAFKEDAFKEGETGVIEMSDEPNVIQAMLQYFYSGAYSTPKEIVKEDTMRFHLGVYTIADVVQHGKLKSLAQDLFEEAAKLNWKHEAFLSIIQAVYVTAPPGPSGDSFRKIVAKVALLHIKSLARNDAFLIMMEGLPEFGKDMTVNLFKNISPTLG